MANILIADSSAMMRQTIEETLADFGHTIHHADGADAALSILEQKKIQVLLLDFDAQGPEPADVIRAALEKSPSTCVVSLIGMGESSKQALDAGAFATLSKPFNIQVLRRIVSESVQHSKETHRIGVPSGTSSDMPAETPKKSKIRIAAFSLAAIVLLSVLSFSLYRFRTPADKTFDVPYGNLSGMAWDGRNFWGSDWLDQSINCHEPDAVLSLKKRFRGDWSPVSIAWDGKNLWSFSMLDSKLHRHKADGSLAIDLDVPADNRNFSSLFFDGNSFWFCDSKLRQIGRFSVENGQVANLISTSSPAQNPIGIFKDKDFIWTADGSTGFIYRHRAGGDYGVIEVFALPESVKGETYASFTSDGKNIWLGTEKSRKILRISKKRLVSVSRND